MGSPAGCVPRMAYCEYSTGSGCDSKNRLTLGPPLMVDLILVLYQCLRRLCRDRAVPAVAVCAGARLPSRRPTRSWPSDPAHAGWMTLGVALPQAGSPTGLAPSVGSPLEDKRRLRRRVTCFFLAGGSVFPLASATSCLNPPPRGPGPRWGAILAVVLGNGSRCRPLVV